MTKIPIPWEHASSRFQCVTLGVIDELQRDFFAEGDLGQTFSFIDRQKAEVIVAETLEADRIWNLPPEELLGKGFSRKRMSDFKRAVIAELFFNAAEVTREEGELEQALMSRNMAFVFLEESLSTPTASPLLWYEDVYWEIAQFTPAEETSKSRDWLVRGLAHNLQHNEGNNARSYLQDLADSHLEGGELDRGLMMLSALLRQDPADIWIYNNIAITFDRYGLTEVGSQAAGRGLNLLEAKGDLENLRSQLEECLKEMHSAKLQGRESEVTPEVLEAFRAALSLDFEAGAKRPINVLSRELVPELAQVAVKRPMTSSDFPLPDRERILREIQKSQAKEGKPKRKKKKRGRRGKSKD
ncbi:MAG: hypothetical protein PVG14_09100 [Anaerolineales bacterium]|jgi:tetratricopeptide (TPR) repeat protein